MFIPSGSEGSFTGGGDQFLPWPQEGSSPPALFNSNRYVNMFRDNERYMGGFTAHVKMSEMFDPYVEFGFMNDRTRVVIWGTAARRKQGTLRTRTE